MTFALMLGATPRLFQSRPLTETGATRETNDVGIGKRGNASPTETQERLG